MSTSTFKIGKLDAARRQLRTAIALWFHDGDPVCVHTLAYAAYEIIHAISKKRDPSRDDLLLDNSLIKEPYRPEWIKRLRAHANFFKHADRDGDAVVDFNPDLSVGFFFFAILGRELCGEPSSDEESIFLWWFRIHKPEYLADDAKLPLAEAFPGESLSEVKALTKLQFFEGAMEARRQKKRGIIVPRPGRLS